MSYENQNITVFGLDRSGLAVVKLFDELGANLLVTDLKSEDELRNQVDELRGRSIEYVLGGHDEWCLEKADLIVISPGVPLDIPILREARTRGILIIGELEIASSVCSCPIVAITGTKGKSTTTSLIGEMLSASEQFANVHVAGNIGVPLSQVVSKTSSDDIAVVEASSFQLETTETFRPKISVILNISPDHLDRHKSMENYIAAKKKTFANQTADDYTVLNANHPIVREFAQETKAKQIFFCSEDKENFVGVFTRNGEIVSNFENEFRSICTVDEIKLPGKHNLENVLAAVSVGLILGVTPDFIRQAILNFTGLEHTFEFVSEIDGVKFINDTKATNVEATRVALETASKPIMLIMGGYDKGNDYSPLIELVKDKVKGLILLGPNTAKIEESLGRYTQIWHCKTMDDAVKLAYSRSSHGDTVLLSPANASFDLFEDYRDRGNQFKEAVRKGLRDCLCVTAPVCRIGGTGRRRQACLCGHADRQRDNLVDLVNPVKIR